MEDSTEPHMETDVSSTTEDLTETQEVTGSDGNVEMIIVVEKMEVEPDADDQNEELSSVADKINDVFMPEEKLPEKETQVTKSPIKSVTQSPAKIQTNTPAPSPEKIQTNSHASSPAKIQTKSAPPPANIQIKSPVPTPEKNQTKSPSPSPAKIETKSPALSPTKIQTKSPALSPAKIPTKSPAPSPAKIQTKSPALSPAKIQTKSPALSPAKIQTMSPAPSPANIQTKSPTLSPATSSVELPSESPNKDGDVSNTPRKPDNKLMNVENKPQQPNEVSPIVTQQVEPADSSIKEPLPIQPEDKQTITQESPKKEVQKLVQKPQRKELVSQDSIRSTPAKESLLIENIPVNGKVQCNDTSKIDDTTTITTMIPIDITIETSNDSQIETMSDISEKEHKGISRELKSLIKSAKESKIINECTQLTSKTRKSRTALDNSSSSLNSSLVEPNKIHDTRRNSDNSQKSGCSETSDKTVLKRSMRSQNPEFVTKVKQFLNSVTGKGHKNSMEEDEVDEKEKVSKDKIDSNESISRATPPKVKRVEPTVTEKNKLRTDSYCWRCHWAVEQVTNVVGHSPMQCTVCPRSFHYKCLTGNERNKINLEKNWVCPECMVVLQAESSETRSPAMKKISLGMLCDLLKHALERMMDLNGVEPFINPVDRASFPDYDKYVVHPMDLTLMKANIGEGLYGSTEAFLADAQWILHNSIIFNTLQSKLTAGARALVRSCRAEMGEIEACPECYAAAHERRPTWFTDVCTTPHILFWAKLKGFPYWPAKGMSVNSAGLVDVRFFGAHDRAWVPSKDCFLYSEKDPNNFRTKRQDIIDSMKEAEQHIRNISRKYGRFVYPPFKTQFDPAKMNEQLKMMIPTFEGDMRSLVKEKASPAAAKGKSRSNSKSSKSSFNDGYLHHSDSSDSDGEELLRLYTLLNKTSDISENEDTQTVAARKMADGAEIAKMDEEDSTQDKDVIEIEIPPMKVKENSQSSTSTANATSRKRRRSELDEAIITIIESSGSGSSSFNEKRKRVEEDKKEENKPKESEPNSRKAADEPQITEKPEEETTEGKKAKKDVISLKVTSGPSNIEKEKTQRVTPIRIALVKDKRHTRKSISTKEATAKIITPNRDKSQEKTTPQRQKSARIDKQEKTPSTKTETPEKPKSAKAEQLEKTSTPKLEKVAKAQTPKSEKVDKAQTPKSEKVDKVDKTTKEGRSRSEKRTHSRSSRSTNSTSSTRSTDRPEKRTDKTAEPNSNKEKTKENSSTSKEKETETVKSKTQKQVSAKPVTDLQSPKSVKDRLQFDDDTTLAVLARETGKSVVLSNATGLPTISSVRSLSTTVQNTSATITKTTTTVSTIDITEEVTSDSSIFTATSTENVKTMKDAVSKLQRLRNDVEPVVGRVGVRAFARMTSPERQKNDDVQVEIKAEPIDLDDADRHIEKMDLMNAFRLRPVNPQNMPSALRDVRINKVLVTPLNARKVTPKPQPEIRPRAKKTFPQPKKPDEGRSDLNSKNSMVYIPIQPPMTQAPVRLPRPQHAVTQHGSLTVTTVLRPPVTATGAATANNLVNTVTTPLMQASSSPSTTSTATTITSMASVPTVHTVPLMTSVNGQWMFSLQPVMSVGAIDRSSEPALVNGVSERGKSAVSLVSSSSTVGMGPAPPITILSRASADTTLGEPPRLQQRPLQFLLNPLDPNTPINSMPPPSTAGPVTAKLNQNAVKMTDFFRALLEDSLEKIDEPVAQLSMLKQQLEQTNWRHQQEIKELKHNQELTLAEMRTSFEKEKVRAITETRKLAQVELEAAIKQTKTKQWCANCSQEAQFYCCWNTSYCDYPCQRAHWTQHFSACQQRSQDGTNGEMPSSPENRLQPQPEMPKSSPAPSLTVGGKLAPPRPFQQDTHSTQKTSIIVSMVEDVSGNQTMKCVGTYKPPTPGQMPPIIINKQLMNSEENANKKVVSSSGGYLIVGGPNNSSVMTPARRTHTIQYYT